MNARWNDLVNAPFEGGYPTPEATKLLKQEAQFQRAVQLYDWALPAVALESMRVACAEAFGSGSNTIVRWRRIGPETLAVTSNPDVSYAFAWLDLKTDGPTVVEAAPDLQGLIDDAWQRPITDIGAAGPDRGAGGRFLIVPPGYDGPIPDGFFVCHSLTNRVFVFLRGFFSAEYPDAGLAQIDQTRIYPLGATDPAPVSLVDGVGVPMNGLPPVDSSYFDRLAQIFDYEPAEPEHFTMRGFAASIGIVQGTPFETSPESRELLDAAAAIGDKIAAAIAFAPSDDIRVWPDRRWTSNMVPGPNVISDPQFKAATYQDFDGLITFFYSAFSTSNAMFIAMPGKGAQYVGGFFDSDGNRPTGANTYTLHLPADVPVANYWSIVLYDAETRCLVDNGSSLPSVASNAAVELNADGSADVHFGPNPPEGEPNWIQTVPGRGYFVALRLYGPTQRFFDRTWTPGDVALVAA
ncbi:DUF1254 domain-containing protein [Subtercola sp. YIM 133946]|uniref:DUF1254 domain-containing protein n=1 Tax=Subtercola sp. YIM 133946 TaxID=3118909 RepID=UPI002F920086